MNNAMLDKVFKAESFDDLMTCIKPELCRPISLGNLNDKIIVLFGASFVGKNVLKSLRKKGINPKYFCDNDRKKWGICIDGLYVLPPDFIKNDITNIVCIVCVMSLARNIIEQLKKLNATYLFADCDGTLGYMPSPNLYINMDKLNDVNELLIDDFSRKVYLNVIKARIFQDFSFELSGSLFMHSIATGLQYFDNQFFKYYENEVFIDCGAYDGDSLVEFSMMMDSMNLKNYEIYAFEPDKINYQKVLETVKQYDLKDVTTFNLCISNCNQKMSIEEIQNCRHTDEEYEIRTCKIDDIMGNKKVTFIKMDIEGFELDALKGSENIIKKYKPKLAISIYHNSSDLYEIPLYIKSIVPEYKFFVRHHSYSTIFETICYAYIEKE